jgi:CheY-like chemotaxis protein
MLQREKKRASRDHEREEDNLGFRMDDSEKPRVPDSTRKSQRRCSEGRPLRVVLAEDDEAMRQMVRSSLSRKGFHVLACSNGAELAAVVEGQTENEAPPPIDVIVSDVQMPGRTGLECLRSIRRLNRQVPFIIITAFGDKATYEDAFRSGATAVLDKPFDLEELVHAIRKAVSSEKQRGRL